MTSTNLSLTLDTTSTTGSANHTFNGDIRLGSGGSLSVTGDVVLGGNIIVVGGGGVTFNNDINADNATNNDRTCLLYTSPSPRD